VHGFFPGRVEPATHVLCPRQVHGTRVVTADPDAERPEADGLATAARGTVVGIVTADCVPVLLVAPRRRVVAAVHAGWRGAAGGIVATALAHLRERFDVEPSDVEAALGPAIGPCCYEVGADVRDAFERTSRGITSRAWRPRERGFSLDLRHAVELLLADAGVRSTTRLGPCTRCSPAYCSYRRDGAGTGRQVSFIGWA
jgi:YfiH family protein